MKLEKMELLFNFILHEFKTKYKGTLLGIFWTILEPLVIISILLFVFTKLFRPNMENYPSFIIIGFISWNFFLKGTSTLSAIVEKSSLVKSSMMPKEFIVISACSIVLITSVLEFCILLVVLAFQEINFTISLVYLPLIILFQFFFILGISLIFNSLYVKFRDLEHIWKVVSEALFFSTPIIYPNSLLIKDFPMLLVINPMAHFITNIRKIILYGYVPEISSFLILFFISLTTLIAGIIIFRMHKDSFAEEI